MVRSNASGLSSSLKLHRNICTTILIGLTLISLSGCNFASSQDRDSTTQNSTEARREELKTDIPGAKDLTVPPSGNGGFSVNPVSLNAPGSTANSDLQPAKGLSSKRLFSESLGEEGRLDRLEAAVQAMRDEFDTVTPAINRLIAVESDIQELVAQLNTLVQNEGGAGAQNDEISATQLDNGPDAINRAMGIPASETVVAEGALQNVTGETPQPPPAPPAAATSQPLPIAPPPPPMAAPAPPVAPPPAPAMQAPANRTETPQSPPVAAVPPPRPPDPVPSTLAAVTQTTTPPAAAGQPQLANLRMADSAGKTRIVMEATGPMSYTADVDNIENILTLVFPAGTSVDPAAFGSGSKLIRSVSMTPQASGGFILAFTLNKGSSIVNQGKIAPNADNPRHRLFVDLAN